MNINKQLHMEVFQGLQKQFIVETVAFDFLNHPNGHFDIAAMIGGKVLPPDQSLIATCSATIWERPWKVQGDRILSKSYKLHCHLSPGIGSKQIVSMLLLDYKQQKGREKSS